MTLSAREADAPAPTNEIPQLTAKLQQRPLVWRCVTCKRPVSKHRHYCKACLDAAIEKIATGHSEPGMLEKVCEQTTSAQRIEILQRLDKLRADNGLPRLIPEVSDEARLPEGALNPAIEEELTFSREAGLRSSEHASQRPCD